MTQAGDILLVAGGSDWESRVIRTGTRSHWCHVAIFMDSAGRLLCEATRAGIAFADIAKYSTHETHVIDTGLTDEQRIAACRFAASCVGQRYGTAQIAAIMLAWATHGRVFFGVDKTETCSSYASRCLEHAGVVLNKSPELMSPADLALLFQVLPRLER